MKLKTYDKVLYKGEKVSYIGQKSGSRSIILLHNGNRIHGVSMSEIKPVIKTAAILGCKHKLYNIETGLCFFCNEKVV